MIYGANYQLQLDSVPGEGTCARIVIPELVVPAKITRLSDGRAEPLRTIVVDDEQLAREELCFLLGQLDGVEVVGQAGNGIEALRVIEETAPDLVMLDVQMPGLTGFEVARRLRPGRRRRAARVRHGLRPARHRGVRGERGRLPAEAGRSRPAGDGGRPGAAADPGDRHGRQSRRRPTSWSGCCSCCPSAGPPGAAGGQGRRPVPAGPADEVVHASVEDDVITVVTNSLSGTSNYRTLDELQARLDPAVFWRVHRSHLVNINKIKEIVPWFSRNYILKMKDGKGTEIPVSRSQTKRLREYLRL